MAGRALQRKRNEKAQNIEKTKPLDNVCFEKRQKEYDIFKII